LSPAFHEICHLKFASPTFSNKINNFARVSKKRGREEREREARERREGERREGESGEKRFRLSPAFHEICQLKFASPTFSNKINNFARISTSYYRSVQ
jgi:hypothetical protein